MLLILLLVIIIVMVIINFSSKKNLFKLRELNEKLKTIISNYPNNKSINYTLTESSDYTKVFNKKEIHLFIGIYNDHTLLNALIHEVSHVICEEDNHTNKFDEINKKLLDIAINSKLLILSKIENDYPCISE